MTIRLTCLLLLGIATLAPAADAPPIDPAGLPGPIVLAGGRGNDDAIKAFVDLAGKDKARIVIIPTAIATAGDDRTDADAIKPLQDLKPLSVAILHTTRSKEGQ